MKIPQGLTKTQFIYLYGMAYEVTYNYFDFETIFNWEGPLNRRRTARFKEKCEQAETLLYAFCGCDDIEDVEERFGIAPTDIDFPLIKMVKGGEKTVRKLQKA